MRGRFTIWLAAPALVVSLLAVAPVAAQSPQRAAAAAVAVASPTAIAVASGEHACALLSDQTVTCWGGHFDAARRAESYTAITAGMDFYSGTCGLRADQTIDCWGDGYGDFYLSGTPPAGTFTSIGVGRSHGCGVRTDQTLVCWAQNGPPPVPPPGTFISVSAGWAHSCAIRTDHTVACWGQDYYGETVAPPGTFTAVDAGGFYTCGVLTGGSLDCWGRDDDGVATPPPGSFTALSAGNWHACGVKSDGTLACWGANVDGNATPPSGTYTAVGAGSTSSSAVTTAGAIATWGAATVTPVVLDPAGLTYGSVLIGSLGTPQTVTVHNLGAGSATVGSILAQPEFPIDEGCTDTPLASLGSCELSVGFTPQAIGARTGAVEVGWGTLPNVLHVALSGVGADPVSITPAGLDFGNAYPGRSDASETVTVNNLGEVPLTVTSAVVSNGDEPDFTLESETCTGAPIAPSTSCTLTVGFLPMLLGARAGTLTLTGPSPLDSRFVQLTGTGFVTPSGVAWDTTAFAGPPYTLNAGNAFARTVLSGSQRLHLAYATDRIGSTWAKDAGPHAGVYYVRSTSGKTWGTPKRLNPTTQHAVRLGLAAAGARVYVTWVSQTKLYAFSPTAPRVLYVRVNANHGDGTAWKATIRLTSTSGRVDYPTVAASGNDAYIAYTDSNTGSVRLATSHDRGATWKTVTLGSTKLSGSSGKIGFPAVSASGGTVAVAWLADGVGAIRARISSSRGAAWGPTQAVAPASTGYLALAARGPRVAAVWATDADVVVRQATGSVWGDPIVVASLTTASGAIPASPTIQLHDPMRVAVAWAEVTGFGGGPSRLQWAESADGGGTWFRTQTLATTMSSGHRSNEYPAIVWPAAATRYIVWNGFSEGTNKYRLYLRRGTGTPMGPAMAATAWEPSPVSSAGGGGVRRDASVSPRR